MQYQHTPLDSSYSPSELLNSRQLLLPSPVHAAQGKQARIATKSQLQETSRQISRLTSFFKIDAPCYALYRGPKRDLEPRCMGACSGDQGVPHCQCSCDSPGTNMAVPQRPATSPIRGERGYRSGRDTFKVINPRKCCFDREQPTAVPPRIPEARRPKGRSWRLPSDDQFGEHNLIRSERLRMKRHTSMGPKILGKNASG